MAAVLLAAIGMAACSSAPAPAPDPAPVPAPAEAPPPPPLPMVSPRTASGSYQLRVNMQASGQQRGRQPASTLLRLDAQPTAAPMMGAPSGSQFNAVISVPGYTRAPRGRPGAAAAWWPIPGDSVIVQFVPQQQGAQIQLRGAVRSDGMAGEIWYLSLETGSTFQIGTFTATRTPPARGR